VVTGPDPHTVGDDADAGDGHAAAIMGLSRLLRAEHACLRHRRDEGVPGQEPDAKVGVDQLAFAKPWFATYKTVPVRKALEDEVQAVLARATQSRAFDAARAVRQAAIAPADLCSAGALAATSTAAPAYRRASTASRRLAPRVTVSSSPMGFAERATATTSNRVRKPLPGSRQVQWLGSPVNCIECLAKHAATQ